LGVNTEFGHLVSLFFFVAGVSSLVFPYKIQAAALKKRAKFWGFPNPFLGWTETQGYIWMLRILGAVAIAAALFIEIVILFGLKPNP
jgi:hypothetical protein